MTKSEYENLKAELRFKCHLIEYTVQMAQNRFYLESVGLHQYKAQRQYAEKDFKLLVEQLEVASLLAYSFPKDKQDKAMKILLKKSVIQSVLDHINKYIARLTSQVECFALSPEAQELHSECKNVLKKARICLNRTGSYLARLPFEKLFLENDRPGDGISDLERIFFINRQDIRSFEDRTAVINMLARLRDASIAIRQDTHNMSVESLYNTINSIFSPSYQWQVQVRRCEMSEAIAHAFQCYILGECSPFGSGIADEARWFVSNELLTREVLELIQQIQNAPGILPEMMQNRLFSSTASQLNVNVSV